MNGSPRWAYFVCCSLVAASFFMFVFTLDRYPSFFMDEPWWNISAVRYLDGESFAYTLHTQAPYQKEAFASHGPFFFRLQILTFKLLGPSHFACRLPSYVGGHLAVLLLCLLLLRKGCFKAALGVAVLWIGDRANQELLLGRPEGVSHLLAVLGFLCLVKAIERRSPPLFAAVGFCMGMACGVHPAAVILGLAVFVLVVALVPLRELPGIFVCLALGLLIPFVLVVWCWMPHPVLSFEQFWWYYRLSTTGGFGFSVDRLLSMWHILGMSRYWYIALFLLTLLVLLPLSAVEIANYRRRESPSIRIIMAVCASVFALGGVLIFLNSSVYPYYLIYFTIWPLLALGIFLEYGGTNYLRFRVLLSCLFVVVMSWLPSLFWNVMRCREAIILYEDLDRREIGDQLKRIVSAESTVMGNPMYFFLARDAGVHFEPLPWYCIDRDMRVPKDVWLIISPRYVDILNQASPANLAGRQKVFEGVAFNKSKWTRHKYMIYGPSPLPTAPSEGRGVNAGQNDLRKR